MNTRGYIPLDYAVAQIRRLLRLKFGTQVRVRQGVRSAILMGDMKVFWLAETAYEDAGRVYYGDAVTQAPAYPFENDAAAEQALDWSTLPTKTASMVGRVV